MEKSYFTKKGGGLGIRDFVLLNQVFRKVSLSFINDSNLLWTQVLRKKYIKVSPNVQQRIIKNCSVTWRALKSTKNIVFAGIKWVIGNGHKIRFWDDKWLSLVILRDKIHGALLPVESNIKISDCINQGFWNLNQISFDLPKDILSSIFGTPFSITNKEDRLIWGLTKDGKCSIKSIYFWLKNLLNPELFFDLKWIWKIKTYPKIQNFIWQIFLNRIPTRELLIKRGLNVPPLCEVCKIGLDFAPHIFRECTFAMNFWHQLGIPSSCYNYFDLDFLDWFKLNLTSNEMCCNIAIPWTTMVSFGIWNP